jgi:hypothetical protein
LYFKDNVDVGCGQSKEETQEKPTIHFKIVEEIVLAKDNCCHEKSKVVLDEELLAPSIQLS